MATNSKFELLHMDKVINNLNKEVRKLERRTDEGLVKVGEMFYERMEPKIPVYTGNLRSSWFIVSRKGAETPMPSFLDIPERMDAPRLTTNHAAVLQLYSYVVSRQKQPAVVIGFSAYYAKAVHEMIDKEFKRPGAQARFMYSTLEQNFDRALSILAENVRVR